MLPQGLKQQLRVDSMFWRRAFNAGVRYGPPALLRYSPPLFGIAFAGALKGPRESTLQTLRKLRGPRPAWQEARDVAAVFANFASSMTDALLVGSERGYQATVRAADGGKVFQDCRAMNRGTILATASTAGWDIAGPLASNLESEEVLVVMSREQDASAMELHNEARARAGVRVVHVGDDPLAALPLLQQLRKRKGLVAFKFDRYLPGMRCRSVRFLNEPWQIPEGMLHLAALAQAPILPVFTRRLGFLRYEYVPGAPMFLPRRPTAAQLDSAAQTLASLLESFARDNPTQWFRFSDG